MRLRLSCRLRLRVRDGVCHSAAPLGCAREIGMLAVACRVGDGEYPTVEDRKTRRLEDLQTGRSEDSTRPDWALVSERWLAFALMRGMVPYRFPSWA